MSLPFSDSFLQTRLRLSHLHLLAAIAEEGSLAKAARRLNISQPAATKLLKDIERSLGVPIFERSRHGVSKTIYGEQLVPAVQRILGEVRQLTEGLNALRAGTSGRVIVGTLISATTTLLPLATARLHARWPSIATRVVQDTDDTLLPLLRNGELDMIVGRLPELDDGRDLSMQELYREAFVVAGRAGHPFVERGRLAPADLASAEWVLPPAQTTTRQQFTALFVAAGLPPPRVVAESASILFNLRLVEASDLLSLVPRHLAEDAASRGALAPLDFDVPPHSSRIGIVTLAGRAPTPAAREMISAIRSIAAERFPAA